MNEKKPEQRDRRVSFPRVTGCGHDLQRRTAERLCERERIARRAADQIVLKHFVEDALADAKHHHRHDRCHVRGHHAAAERRHGEADCAGQQQVRHREQQKRLDERHQPERAAELRRDGQCRGRDPRAGRQENEKRHDVRAEKAPKQVVEPREWGSEEERMCSMLKIPLHGWRDQERRDEGGHDAQHRDQFRDDVR